MHHFSDGLKTFPCWREGGGGKGNRCMTYHIWIQLGTAHSSPITICVHGPMGDREQGISLHLCGCRSALLAMARAGKVCRLSSATSPHAQPHEPHHCAIQWVERGQILPSESKPCITGEPWFWGMRTALRFVVLAFKRLWGAQLRVKASC